MLLWAMLFVGGIHESDAQTPYTLQSLASEKDGNYDVQLTNAVLTYLDSSGKYFFLETESAAMMVYFANGISSMYQNYLKTGVVLNGTLNVTFSNDQGMPKITAFNNLPQAIMKKTLTYSFGSTPQPNPITLKSLSEDFQGNLSRYVIISGAAATQEGSFFGLHQGDYSIKFLGFNDAEILEDHQYNLIGFPYQENGDYYFAVFALSDMEDITPAQLITPTLYFRKNKKKVTTLTLYKGNDPTTNISLYSKELDDDLMATVTVTNDNEDVVSYADGTLTPKKMGVATLTATFPGSEDYASATAILQVIVSQSEIYEMLENLITTASLLQTSVMNAQIKAALLSAVANAQEALDNKEDEAMVPAYIALKDAVDEANTSIAK